MKQPTIRDLLAYLSEFPQETPLELCADDFEGEGDVVLLDVALNSIRFDKENG